MTKIIKILIIKLLFFLFVINNNVFSKPLPPGSGEGDVPVNILLLLDSSESMKSNPFGGDALSKVGDIVLLNDGDILVGQLDNAGIVKIDYDNEEIDTSFAYSKAVYYGNNPKELSCAIDGGAAQTGAHGTTFAMAKSENVQNYAGTEVIYATGYDKNKVSAFDKDGNCLEIIWHGEMGRTRTGSLDAIYPTALTIKTLDDGTETNTNNDYLIVTGKERWCTKKHKKKKHKCANKNHWKQRSIMYSRNLTTGEVKNCSIKEGKLRELQGTPAITMDEQNTLYLTFNNEIYKLPMEKKDGVYCPKQETLERFARTGTNKSTYNDVYAIEVDPEDDNFMYATSNNSSSLQKLKFNDDRDVLSVATNSDGDDISVGGADNTAATAAAAADTNLSNAIAMFQTKALYVGNDRVWTGGEKRSIQEFDISGNSIKWKAEMGTSRLNRIEGARKAIEAVVTDSAFLQTANFGYGHWNAGEKYCKPTGKAKDLWGKKCESTCNKECPIRKGKPWYWKCNDNCNYYGTWVGDHPEGQSSNCIGNSCLKVGIGKNNSADIVDAVNKTGLEFGTDANAFAKIAYKYFTDPKVVDSEGNPLVALDPADRKTCQLNYVIVIGDGMWRHHDDARPLIVSLRQNYDVKTIFIAYGKDIDPAGEDKFEDMALAGSCDAEGNDCRDLITAKTPQDLLNKLKSEVARLTATRLSFTAPSITASLSEGGSLYQAQFDYVQHGEWKGKLLRKTLREDGSIIHDINHPDNYDSAEILRQQANSDDRRIWTTLKGTDNDYRTDYNNFVPEKSSSINELFTLLGEVVPNYHTSTSECGPFIDDPDNKLDTNEDDIKGLIKFVRGEDYFAYEGCENIGQIRPSVLGDIYHSQIVQVGDPNANTNFTRNNQEAYWRSINNYGTWAKGKQGRGNVMYVGANDGALHAFATEQVGEFSKGQEIWAFVPPFIAAKLPGVINDALDGYKPKKGGTNSIFAVDGSPVIHDVFIRGLTSTGDYKEVTDSKSWVTILMVTYGRGGQGFSVLDITNPLTPYHMFSVYNDTFNNIVYIADKDGNIDPHPYATAEALQIGDSLEAFRAMQNEAEAEAADLLLDDTGDDFTTRDNVATCQSNDNITAGTGTFAKDGDNACYKGKSWTFIYDNFPAEILADISLASATQIINNRTVPLGIESITQNGNEITFTFDQEHVYNRSTSSLTDKEETVFSIRISNDGTEDKSYDYSKLGETWAAPRIIRLPAGNTNNDTIDTDRYVAVLSGGYGAVRGIGSALFLVDLEDTKTNGGSIYGALENNGPISIVDMDNGTGGEIHNSIPTDPIVITPDTFKGVSWRGAMVYLNDFEGKITKINLTNQRDEGNPERVNIFDQTTLYSLGANNTNERYSFFGMDAAYGSSTNNLWLFGSTGDFSDIGGKKKGMDNILYGLRDRDFPLFKHSDKVIPSPTTDDGDTDLNFLIKAKEVAEEAPLVDDLNVCARSRDDGGACTGATKEGWIFQLDEPYDKSTDVEPKDKGPNKYRKASASPTVFRGTVYYPVYEPPQGEKKCSVGNAFICSADDECGTNTSKKIAYAQKDVRADSEFGDDSGCYYLQPGILSKLVVFGDKLFANVTTESDKQEDTLVTLLGGEGEIQVYRGSWRENY